MHIQLENSTVRRVIDRVQHPLDVMLVCRRWYAAYPLRLRHLKEMTVPNEESSPTMRRCIVGFLKWLHARGHAHLGQASPGQAHDQGAEPALRQRQRRGRRFARPCEVTGVQAPRGARSGGRCCGRRPKVQQPCRNERSRVPTSPCRGGRHPRFSCAGQMVGPAGSPQCVVACQYKFDLL